MYFQEKNILKTTSITFSKTCMLFVYGAITNPTPQNHSY